MNKKELIEKVAATANVSKQDTASVVNALLNEIEAALKAGEQIAITGFGSFKVVDRPAREARNPRTGEKITVPASKVPKFVPGKSLKDALN
ncbi:DNA-binding protein HU-beta [Desulfacinum infernum DSM 9756]|uniref:DNA-binding protein HU-beta n=2 Tax=Desulfacinum infernum TaxID=35837 RepID=A0A1M5IH25_9BACT|nr:DNA-binding protein HU-beta [Desulfacinum infernum DSM 9756]